MAWAWKGGVLEVECVQDEVERGFWLSGGWLKGVRVARLVWPPHFPRRVASRRTFPPLPLSPTIQATVVRPVSSCATATSAAARRFPLILFRQSLADTSRIDVMDLRRNLKVHMRTLGIILLASA